MKPRISPLEVEILDALILGKGDIEIGRHVCVAVSTVKKHLQRIAYKFGHQDVNRIKLAVEWYYRLNPDKRI